MKPIRVSGAEKKSTKSSPQTGEVCILKDQRDLNFTNPSNYIGMHMLFLFPNTVFLILKSCCKCEGQSGVWQLGIPKQLLVPINNQSTLTFCFEGEQLQMAS